MVRNWTPATDAELTREIIAARRHSKIASPTEPRAARASYDRATKRIVVELTDGWMFAFPARDTQGLSEATAAQLSAVEIAGNGYALHWDALDAHYTVAGLLAGRIGSRLWMRELARKAGSSRSTAKAAAARRNGKKGGRPRGRSLTRAG